MTIKLNISEGVYTEKCLHHSWMPFLNEWYDSVLKISILPLSHYLPTLPHIFGEEFSGFYSKANAIRLASGCMQGGVWAGVSQLFCGQPHYYRYGFWLHSCSWPLYKSRALIEMVTFTFTEIFFMCIF